MRTSTNNQTTVKIKNLNDEILYSHTEENNSLKITLEKAVQEQVDLTGADLRNEILNGLNLDFAILKEAQLENTNLENTSLYNANLCKANLRNTNLYMANLSYSQLCSADLSRSLLWYANLKFANMTYTNLTFTSIDNACLANTDLSHAYIHKTSFRKSNLKRTKLLDVKHIETAILNCTDLSETKTDKRFIQISCIGSEKRITTYCFDNDFITCGCFKGTLKEFKERVLITHKENSQYLKEYLGAIAYIESLK